MDEGDDALHVLAKETTRGEGRGAQPDTAGVHGRFVPGDRVLIHHAHLTHEFRHFSTNFELQRKNKESRG